jgi:leucine dehydrogenase
MISAKQIDVSSHPEFDSHEQIVEFICDETGLHSIIAVHNTNLGSALGGCRFYPYATRDDAITDVLRLSKGMTYKSALAGLALGGGKSVIIGNPQQLRSPALLTQFANALEHLNGKYVVAEDVGTTEHDMVQISKTTSYVAGLPSDNDQSHVSGNPSPVTALGTFCGIKACVKHKLNRVDLNGLHIAIQGLGAVGRALADYLLDAGCRLTIADINDANVQSVYNKAPDRVKIVSTDQILQTECDILAPCAMGAILNDETIPQLRTSIIAGAANNQLKQKHHDQKLFDADILYAPDYAINSGGITSVGYEYFARTDRNPYPYELTNANMLHHVHKIEQTLLMIFDISKTQKISTGQAADQLAERIFKKK